MAQKAIKAAKLWNVCGSYAMQRYAEKHGVDMRLIRLARQLEAVTKVGF